MLDWLKDWQWFGKADTLQLFLYLLVNANTEDKYWQGTLVKRGQIVVTIPKLVEALDSTVQRVRTNIARLLKSQSINRQLTVKYSIITICNYDSYMAIKTGNQQSTNSQLTGNQQTTEEKKKENIPPTPPIKEKIKEDYSPPLTLTGEPTPSKKTPKEIYFEVVDLWHKICVDLPSLRNHSESRKKKVLCRVSQMGGYEKAIPIIEEVFRKAQNTGFCKGDNNRGWKAFFDWFFENDTNWCKVLEGVFERKNYGRKTFTTDKTEYMRQERERIMREVSELDDTKQCDYPPPWYK